ncbi:class I SAM-dependent methyltransferase [Massilia sp. W12]|uniref:class I SAM-dependent methyltransferase n=1 Tax=Massilia sp. W12 TaxID=3126507 RepID=UPI0030CE3F1B
MTPSQTAALRRPWWRSPALRALLAQLFALVLLRLCLPYLVRLVPPEDAAFRILLLACMQGALAAALAFMLGLQRWWWLIQFLFPLALVYALQWRIAPAWYLAAFVFSVLLYWSTFRTQVPYYPSGSIVWRQILSQLPDGPCRVADLGSGLGGMLLFLEKQRPDLILHGVEMAPLPWLISRLRAKLCGSRVQFLRCDYQSLDLGQYDLVFAYLAPPAMPSLWLQLKEQMRPGSHFFSYEFPVPGHVADYSIVLGRRARILYGWRF